jgi:5-oxoprolinase (ATP-hydrolysing)
VEVSCRVRLVREGEDVSRCAHPVEAGPTGELVEVLAAVDEAAVERDLAPLLAAGITSLAVVLLHSSAYRAHEEAIGAIARRMGFSYVSLSSSLVAMPRIVPRGLTCCVDAYLTPVLREYMEGFYSGFDEGIRTRVKVLFMQSDGGLAQASDFSGYRAILSGPAGGVVGFASTAFENGVPVIGFDMGGTSCDVSRFAGKYEHVYDVEVAGVQIQAPQLDITTVAAGGGSRLLFEAGMFVVGPDSVGANPGPVCYRRAGGLLSVTDANLHLGRLPVELFPKIFGPAKDQPLDAEATARAFAAITADVNRFYAEKAALSAQDARPTVLTEDQVALGFIQVANEAMCRPIRAITQARGFDTSRHTLACFGGAGGQHACAIARSLGMKRVVIHRFAGILSAGMMCDKVDAREQPYMQIF